jgi:hypothetical protein
VENTVASPAWDRGSTGSDSDLANSAWATGNETVLHTFSILNSRSTRAILIGRAAPLPMLFQFAIFEQYFSRSAMERYARAANQLKPFVGTILLTT